jgi:hypothetical protein
MKKISARYYLFALLFLFIFFPKPSYAEISACSVSLSSSSIILGSSGNSITFTVTNNDGEGNLMKWVQFVPPDQNYSTEGNTSFNDFEVAPGDSIQEVVNVNSIGSASSPSPWFVQTSDNVDGIGVTTCTGDLNMAIIDTNPPVISVVVVSSITDTSAVISWTTNKDATSELDYGETTDYGFTKRDGNPSVTHSFVLDSLTPAATYHFNIKTTDEMGTSETGDNSFITGETPTATSPPATITITNTRTVTNTRIVTPSPTPTPIPDRTPPSVSIATDFSKAFSKAPLISGRASDNKGVSSVDYSLDDGKNWSPVSTLLGSSFSFAPGSLEDGNYKLKVRARDKSGNVGYSKVYEMVIDRLPPMIGGTFFSIGPLTLSPNEDGIIVGLEDLSQKMTFSAVGGPVLVNLVLNSQKYPVLENKNNGLWSNSFNLSKPGIYRLKVHLIDGAKNETDKNLSSILILPAGKIINALDKKPIQNAELSVFVFDNITQEYILWDGKSYLQSNPQTVSAEGKYKLFLPTGKYYLQIQAKKYKTLKTSIFSLEKSTLINTNFLLEKAPAVQIGQWFLAFPAFDQAKTQVLIEEPQVPEDAKIKNDLIGQDFPKFSLAPETNKIIEKSLGSKKLLITVLNTWLPQASEQLKILDSLVTQNQISVLVIVPQESISKVNIFKKAGGYKLDMVADSDGTLIKLLNLQSLPQHFFLDKKSLNKRAVIEQIRSGLLTKKQLLEGVGN